MRLCAAHTHTHCVGTLRGWARLLHRECVVSVRVEKYQVCGVRKFVQLKVPKIYLFLKQKPSNMFYDILIIIYDHLGVN